MATRSYTNRHKKQFGFVESCDSLIRVSNKCDRILISVIIDDCATHNIIITHYNNPIRAK